MFSRTILFILSLLPFTLSSPFIISTFEPFNQSPDPPSLSSNSTSPIITSLTNKQNNGYYLALRIGEPSKNNLFEMMIDISTPWTWVPDVECFNCFKTNLRSKYYDCEYNGATCFENQTAGIQTLSYPFGSVLAFEGYDQIEFEGFPTNGSLNHSMSFTVKVTHEFYDISADGIIGLGPLNTTNSSQKLGNGGLTSIVDLMYGQGWIANRSFSLFLTDNLEGEDDESQLIFGGYNPEKVADGEEFQTVPIVDEDFWAIKLNGMKLGDTDLMTDPANVILSTTYEDIGVSQTELTTIVGEFEKLGIICQETSLYPNYICPCKEGDLSLFPDLKLELENATLTIPNNVYMGILGIDINEDDGFVIKKNDHCVLKFQNVSKNAILGDNWIFGRAVMSYYHIVFDADNKSIAFAVANNPIISGGFSLSPIIWLGAVTLIFMIISTGVFIYKCVKMNKQIGKEEKGEKDEKGDLKKSLISVGSPNDRL